MKKIKNSHELVDWLLVHLAQSKAYMNGKKTEECLAWRLKTGKLRKKDHKYIKWAIEFLKTNNIYIEKDRSKT